MKKYIKYSAVFLALGVIGGVFYREFSKAYGVVNTYTPLGLVHPHFLVLGVAFMLIIGLVTEKLNKTDSKLLTAAVRVYSAGVLGTGIMLFARGISDVLQKSAKLDFEISKGANGAMSGIAGMCHIVLGVGLVMIFIGWLLSKKPATVKENAAKHGEVEASVAVADGEEDKK